MRAVAVMLGAGWPVDARGQHRATPLHWAAWNGNVEMVARRCCSHGAPIDVKGDEYDGTPLFWAIYGRSTAGIAGRATTPGSWRR